MRTTQAFVLRLLVDSDEPWALRGVLQAVASGEEAPFTDEPTLLALLRRMMSAAPESTLPVKGKT
ncbi:MAG: hypothetical protein JW900_05710 [Anaerolineae bacterium]|nr:hypothetical protein [Anaerolineae bacterium]